MIDNRWTRIMTIEKIDEKKNMQDKAKEEEEKKINDIVL